MKKTILTVISSLLIASVLRAGVDVTTAYTSDYYFRGTQLAQSIIETAVDYSEGDFYMGVWTAQPFEDAEDGSEIENEIDFYGGYGIALSETAALDIGIAAYMYPELDDGDEITYEPFIGIAFDTPLAPSFYVYYDLTLESLTLEGSIGHSFEIDESSSIDIGLSVGNVSPDEGDSAMYYLLSAGWGYALAETASLSIGFNYTDGDDELVGGNTDDGFYASIGISVGF